MKEHKAKGAAVSHKKRSAIFKMDRRSLVLRGGGTLAAAAITSSFPAPWVRAAKPVKIGYVSPQTGPLAPFAEADNFIVGSVREVFKKQNLPFEIVVKDSQTNSNRAAEVAADLILKDKVSLMVVGAAPETDNPVADQCELNEVPCVSTVSPWQPWFFARGGKPDKPFKWTYHYFWGLEDAIGIILDMWSQPQLKTNRVVGAAFANDPDGNAWGDAERGLPPALEKNGYRLVHPSHFQTLTDNFSAQISAFKEAGVEIVTGNMIPPDFTTFWTQARQQGLRPKICTITKALLSPRQLNPWGRPPITFRRRCGGRRRFPISRLSVVNRPLSLRRPIRRRPESSRRSQSDSSIRSSKLPQIFSSGVPMRRMLRPIWIPAQNQFGDDRRSDWLGQRTNEKRRKDSACKRAMAARFGWPFQVRSCHRR